MATLLTRTVIEAAKPGTRTFDSEVEGLALRVSSTGGKAFVMRYRHLGQRREIVVGKAADLTASQARRIARAMRAKLAADTDPLADRDRKRAEAGALAAQITLREFAGAYAATVTKKPASKRIDETLLRLHLLPLLGNVAVAEIGKEHAQKLHAVLTKKPVMANRAHALLSHMVAEAARRGLREAPLPRACVVKNAEKPRERYLSPTEHATLWKVLTEMEATAHRDSAQALRLLMLTGCRKSEIVGLQWAEVDGDCLRLKDSKTGSRTVPLVPEAESILEARRPERRCAWVFPNESSTGPRDNIERAWRRARTAAKLDGLRIHDLRHSLAATGIAAGLSLPEIGKLLGHKSSQTTARYAHVSDAVARAAANKVGARLAEIVAAADGLRAVK